MLPIKYLDFSIEFEVDDDIDFSIEKNQLIFGYGDLENAIIFICWLFLVNKIDYLLLYYSKRLYRLIVAYIL